MNPSSPDEQTATSHRGGAIPPGWVKLATYGAADEAELVVAVLAAVGIEATVFGANVNSVDWFWQVFNDVDLIVPEEDVDRARQALSRLDLPDVEPAEEPANAPSPVDKDGNPLVIAASFDNVMDLRDAQTLLASERMKAYGPRLVMRGKSPPGEGRRFILRVAEKDLPAAQALLEEESQEDRDQPRCPRCRAWRVHPQRSFFKGLAGVVGLGGEPATMECHSCHYRGPAAEFLARVDG